MKRGDPTFAAAGSAWLARGQKKPQGHTHQQGPQQRDWLRGNFDPRFSLALARKDLGLALELARATNTPMRLGALCEQEMVEAIGRGWANRDASIFLTLQEERAKVQVRLPPD